MNKKNVIGLQIALEESYALNRLHALDFVIFYTESNVQLPQPTYISSALTSQVNELRDGA